MPLDAVCLSAVVGELAPLVTGAKIDKVYQPTRDEIILSLRGKLGPARLLLTANPNHPRLQIITEAPENPPVPPMFCMLLRKHLASGHILAVSQPPMERLVRLDIEALDEMGVRTRRGLILEAMGRRANLILTDESGRIISSLRRVESDLSAQRQILPGLFYRLPPQQDKADPAALTPETLDALLAAAPAEKALDSWLLATFMGLSPLVCRELAFRACGETDGRFCQLSPGQTDAFKAVILSLAETIKEKQFTPVLLERDGAPFDFTYLPISQYGAAVACTPCASFSQLLDRFYSAKERRERMRQWGQDLTRLVTTARDRAARKLANRRQELAATENRDYFRQCGDLITANLYQMTKGMTALTVSNYYDPEGKDVTIPLDPLRTPQQNAAKYYKDYRKAKTAIGYLNDLIQKGEGELDYLESVLDAIQRAESERDLQEIRQEVANSGFVRQQKVQGKQPKRPASKPMEFRSTAGLRISVGKNNTQNDLLTTKQAFKSDLWLHTQKIHGSHVILWCEGQTPDAQSITEAAILAAYYSQARDGKNVPVDYTPVKYVKKPAGARPGMVVYETYSTAYVTPDESLAQRLRVK